MLSFEFLEKSPGIVSPPGCDVTKNEINLRSKKKCVLGVTRPYSKVPTLNFIPENMQKIVEDISKNIYVSLGTTTTTKKSTRKSCVPYALCIKNNNKTIKLKKYSYLHTLIFWACNFKHIFFFLLALSF